MQLIGIYIYDMNRSVSKVLEKGWFPFGAYPKPIDGKMVVIPKQDDYIGNIYNSEKLPNISVNCIVGMNGAGKSTLLDILYQTINNFACRLLGNKRKNNHGRKLYFARGVNADLYFIAENKQCKIQCRDKQVRFYQEKKEIGAFESIQIRNGQDPKPILKELFYTISTNYSIYAFNQTEYVPESAEECIQTGINGKWLGGVFHKNDGYFTPIVITPFRDGGNIDVQNENYLASQRIMAMAVLSKAQYSSFIDGYEPSSVSYSINTSFQLETEESYQRKIASQYRGLDIRHIIRAFELAWSQYFDEKLDEKLLEKYNLALFYLAYKTVKICMTYDDFWHTFGVESMLKSCESLEQFATFVKKEVPSKAKKIISKILDEIKGENDEHSHITLKIELCKEYVEQLMMVEADNMRWKDHGTMTIEQLIKGRHIKTYNDAVAALPPAFFKVNMTFKKKVHEEQKIQSSWGALNSEEFSIGKLSSGERQMLYSLSYVLYHIKNIQSIREDESRVQYHNICLIFDEAELYYHPEYQRRFLGMLLEGLSWCNINPKIIHSIQILIVTHSPFVLSDILTENTLYLKEGQPQKVVQQTFGANYYDMLNKSFFLEKAAVGEIASSVMHSIVNAANNKEIVEDEYLRLIGDTMVYNYVKSRRMNTENV